MLSSSVVPLLSLLMLRLLLRLWVSPLRELLALTDMLPALLSLSTSLTATPARLLLSQPVRTSPMLWLVAYSLLMLRLPLSSSTMATSMLTLLSTLLAST